MNTESNSTRHLQNFVISIKPIRYSGELDGYRVRITRPDQSVNYIYRFPMDRASVLKVVLTQIGKIASANPSSGRRQIDKGSP